MGRTILWFAAAQHGLPLVLGWVLLGLLCEADAIIAGFCYSEFRCSKVNTVVASESPMDMPGRSLPFI